MHMALILVTFLILLVIGVPVAFNLGISVILYLLFSGQQFIIMPQRMFAGADSFTLMAIPLFIFAGEIMNACGITKRIVKFSQSVVGFIAGGLAHVTIIANIIMAGISGSSTADVAALGGMLIPAMAKAGYNRAYSSAINAMAAAIGSVIPPSILMILYGSITGISIGSLFVAGFVPGLLIGLGFMIVAYIKAKKNPEQFDGEKMDFSWQNLVASFLEAIPALIMPLIIVGGILSGVFTATEAGAVAGLYGILVGIFLFKEIKLSDFPHIILNSASVTGMSMIIVSCAILFSWILAYEGFPMQMANLLTSISSDKNVLLFLMTVIMLIIGCFMDTTSAAIIMVPIFHPIALSLGLNSVHFGFVMVLTFIMGAVTPPVGISLFVATAIGKVTFSDLVKHIWSFLAVMFTVLFATAYIPEIAMFLPRLLGR
jgi:tripartite ATP-independent transporter DctM subunit